MLNWKVMHFLELCLVLVVTAGEPFPIQLSFPGAPVAGAVPQIVEDLVIHSPAEGDVVTGSVLIRGASTLTSVQSCRLELAYDPNTTGDWFFLSNAAFPVTDGTLAEWNSTGVADGNYLLRLSATLADQSVRHSPTVRIQVRNPEVSTGTAGFDRSADLHQALYPREVPASTATFVIGQELPSESGQRGRPLTGMLVSGAAITVFGFLCWRVFRQWTWWRRRQFIRKMRKGG